MVAGPHWHICTLYWEASNDHCRCNFHRMVQIGVFTFLIWRARIWCTWKSWINLPENVPEKPLIWFEKCTDFPGTVSKVIFLFGRFLAAFANHRAKWFIPVDSFFGFQNKTASLGGSKQPVDQFAARLSSHFASGTLCISFSIAVPNGFAQGFCHQSRWQFSTRNICFHDDKWKFSASWCPVSPSPFYFLPHTEILSNEILTCSLHCNADLLISFLF